jgi:hypothetical protein
MVQRAIVVFCVFVAVGQCLPPANGQTKVLGVAQAAQAPKRALPLPNKPVSEDEFAKAARLNNWTVSVAGGLLEGTFIRFAAELAKALDDGDNLRVLPIVSYGAVENVNDLIYLKGVDFAITYSDVLDYFKNVEKIPAIEKRVNYIMPMFQGEVHIFARPEIKSIKDLAGKKVNFQHLAVVRLHWRCGFDRLGVKVDRLFRTMQSHWKVGAKVRSQPSCMS